MNYTSLSLWDKKYTHKLSAKQYIKSSEKQEIANNAAETGYNRTFDSLRIAINLSPYEAKSKHLKPL